MAGDDRSDPFSDMINLFAAPLAGTIRSFDQFRKGVDEFLRGVENFNRTMENLNETAERINVLLGRSRRTDQGGDPSGDAGGEGRRRHDAGGERAGDRGRSWPHPARRDAEHAGLHPTPRPTESVHRRDDRDVEASRPADAVRRVGRRTVRWFAAPRHGACPSRTVRAGRTRRGGARAHHQPSATGRRQEGGGEEARSGRSRHGSPEVGARKSTSQEGGARTEVRAANDGARRYHRRRVSG